MINNILTFILMFFIINSCGEPKNNLNLEKKMALEENNKIKLILPFKISDLKFKEDANYSESKLYGDAIEYFSFHKLEYIDLFAQNLYNDELTQDVEARTVEFNSSMTLKFTIGDLCLWYIKTALAVNKEKNDLDYHSLKILPYPEYLLNKDKFIKWWEVNKKSKIKELQIKILKERLNLVKQNKDQIVSEHVIMKYKKILIELEEDF